MREHWTRRDVLRQAGAVTLGAVVGGTAAHAQTRTVRNAALIVHNARVTTLDPRTPAASAIAVDGGRFAFVGDDDAALRLGGPGTRVIDAGGRRIIPGLNDSHLHLIRGGLNYNLELRWDGVPSLADAMRMLREQVARTPPSQWVRVIGGFCEFQFAERRLPTPDELNQAAPDTPVFILHLYDRALLNRAALRVLGYTKDTPDPPGGVIERDKSGAPTGLLIANPNAFILYKTLSLGPKLSPEHQHNSTRHFMREMNRLGLTSCCDAGGGFQNYPEDYEIVQEMARKGESTVRVAYNLFTQRPKQEKEDFARWLASSKYQQGDDYLRLNGAGEMLVSSAADFEDFRVPRPDLPPGMEGELREVVRMLARAKWPWRLHATYDETIGRALTVFEEVHREFPISDLRWFFDHCETVSDRNLERIKALGGGIAVQNRMAYQGEYFLDRYGPDAAQRTPPIRKMLQMGIPVGAGTDGTRVSSYNPWVSLWWLVSGRTLGGTVLYPDSNRMSREEALRLFTNDSAWFSREEARKGRIAVDHMADLAVLSDDYLAVPENEIRRVESVLTLVGGKIVYAAGPFRPLDPPAPPVMPDWSPVSRFGGAQRFRGDPGGRHRAAGPHAADHAVCCRHDAPFGADALLGGCGCFA